LKNFDFKENIYKFEWLENDDEKEIEPQEPILEKESLQPKPVFIGPGNNFKLFKSFFNNAEYLMINF
jgi:hypothetical protein